MKIKQPSALKTPAECLGRSWPPRNGSINTNVFLVLAVIVLEELSSQGKRAGKLIHLQLVSSHFCLRTLFPLPTPVLVGTRISFLSLS